MRKRVLAVTSALCVVMLGGAANAAITPTLTGSPVATGAAYTFNYNVQLAADQGLSTSSINPSPFANPNSRYGSAFVIYDFAGYVDGSIFAANSNWIATTELVSSSDFVLPSGYTDDASLTNLVFTWNGADFNTGTPSAAPIDLGTFGAQSIYNRTTYTAASSLGEKNSGTPFAQGGTNGTVAFSQNFVLGPNAAAVPEAATWAMMLVGFGGIGAALRGSKRKVRGAFNFG